MVKKEKIKDMGFCILPALIGVFIIFFSILASFSTVIGVHMEPSWGFFMVIPWDGLNFAYHSYR